MADAWAALGRKRRTLARTVYHRDRNTPGYTCPCGQPIDWDLPYQDPRTDAVNPMSKSLDHITELQDGGAILDPDNCWTTHLSCNASKGAARRWQRHHEARADRDLATTVIVDVATLTSAPAPAPPRSTRTVTLVTAPPPAIRPSATIAVDLATL